MDDSYIVNGGKTLKGTITLSGAKNVALKVIIAALLFEKEVILKNIPVINDVKELLALIRYLGGKAEFIEKNTVIIDGSQIKNNKVDFFHGSKIRVSFMLLVPLLNKFNECFIPNPGGCRIGSRPIDRIIFGLKKLNVHIAYNASDGYYSLRKNKKTGGYYCFPRQTHTGTELIVLFAVFADKQTIIDNVSFEPEIDNLIQFLNNCGAKIERKNSSIIISPVKKLEQRTPFHIMSDRNEAVTFSTLAIATKGEITIQNTDINVLKTFLSQMTKIGAGVEVKNEQMIRFYYDGKILPSNIETSPHPGFMTDWQPNWAVLMTQANGDSTIIERVFENRFSYVKELQKLGADIEFINISITNPSSYYFFNYEKNHEYQQAIKIHGEKTLHNGVLTISDLRAGATLVIAALLSKGESIVDGVHILERGYEDFILKIRRIGGNIKKI